MWMLLLLVSIGYGLPPYQIIVTRHNENISWLHQFPEDRVLIYNKGLPCDQPYGTVIQLPNVGRDAHTPLYHIIENYDVIDNDTVYFFTQGRIDDHFNGSVEEEFLNISEYTRRIELAKYPYALRPNGHLPVGYVKQMKTTPFTLGFYAWFLTYINPNINPRVEPIYVWWNCLFSLRGHLIKRRTKEWYQQLLPQLTDGSNQEVIHYFERAWYYIFRLDQP